MNLTLKEKELAEAALALYKQLKKGMRSRDFQEFDATVAQARKISRKGKIGVTKFDLVNKMAELKERDGKNLLHLSAAIAAKEDDTRFFIRLLDLHFPLYTPDLELCFPAFYITGVKTDSKFASCYNALVMQGFDLNCPNRDSVSFLEYLFMNTPSERFDLNKVKSIL